MRRPILFAALTATLALSACGSKGPLVLPPRPQSSTPTSQPATAPRTVPTAPEQGDVSTTPTPTR